MVSLRAIRPKIRVFKPGRGDGFLSTIKIRSTPSFGGEVNPEAPYLRILRHVKNILPLRGSRKWVRETANPRYPSYPVSGGIAG
jgi:hypothetical protein